MSKITLPTLQDRMDEVESYISANSKEITETIKNNSEAEKIDKCTKDLLNKIDECECTKEILDYLKKKRSPEPISREITGTQPRRYKPPNHMASPNAPLWSFEENPK